MAIIGKKGSAVIGMMDSILDSIKGMEGAKPKTLCDVSSAKGFMVSKFIITPYGIKVTDVQGDCKGITGYEPDEFQNIDVMKLLKLNPKQIEVMHHKVITEGICAKRTVFTKKDGTKVKVFSQVVQISDGIFAETTILENKILTL